MDGIVVIILPGGIVRIAVHDTDFFLRERDSLANPPRQFFSAPEYHILVRMCRGVSRSARSARRGRSRWMR